MVPLLQRVTFGKRPKSNQKVSPRRPAPRLGSACLRSVFIWGHRLRSASLRPPLDVFDFVERRYAPTPQMNTSTQPPEGAGRARSRAGELTLGLMSGEERVGVRRSAFDSAFVGARLVREGCLTADQSPSDVLTPIVGVELAREGALKAYQSIVSAMVSVGAEGCNPLIFPHQIQGKKKPPLGGSFFLPISRKSLSSSSLHRPRRL